MTDAARLPRAVNRFGLAAMDARPARARRAPPPKATPPRDVRSEPQPRRVVVRLWLPLTPILLLLAPFPILAIPLLYLLPLRRVNRAAAVFILGDALLALGGTDLLVDTRQAYVRLKIL
jgi:hypothetical protein